MKTANTKLYRCSRLLALGALLLSAVPTLSLASGGSNSDTLRLRVHDVIGTSGGRTIVIVRTYAPRDIEQGQICLLVPPSPTTGLPTLDAVRGARIFGAAGDAIGVTSVESFPDGQRVTATFSSASATINNVEGTMVAIELTLADSAAVGANPEVSIDLDETFLIDAQGIALTVIPRPGDLTIRDAGAPFLMALEGDKVLPGEFVELDVTTFEPFTAASGQIALVYDPAVLIGPPVVAFDARHGNVAITTDASIPGLLFIAFTSPEASFNSVPGKILNIQLQSAAGAPVGSVSAIDFDLAQTFFFRADGSVLPVELGGGEVEFR